jgi:hypothetical protein
MLKRLCVAPSWILGLLACAAATVLIGCATTRIYRMAICL